MPSFGLARVQAMIRHVHPTGRLLRLRASAVPLSRAALRLAWLAKLLGRPRRKDIPAEGTDA